jgi:hypothetical protein
MPDTMPDVFTLVIAVFPELHTPPVVALLYGRFPPTHTDSRPDIGAGKLLTVIVVADWQPVPVSV